MTTTDHTIPATFPATEMTPIGEQALVPGVKPITQRDRLQFRMQTPLQPRCKQKPLNVGLWDEDARNQLDLFASPPPASTVNEKLTRGGVISAGWNPLPACLPEAEAKPHRLRLAESRPTASPSWKSRLCWSSSA